ncbi:C2 domain-containing protein [Lactarius psammicola]|nr:C2 domain-containing protein [Lactarius psammicola]
MASSNTVPKPSRATQLHTLILGRGSNRDSFPYPDGPRPVVILRVQVASCQKLEAKGRNGYIDPFVTVSFWGKRFQTPVCKRNLNPVYEAKHATFDFPVYTSLVFKLGTLEFVVWDKNIIRNNYLGEYSLPIDRLFKGTTFACDGPDNQVRGDQSREFAPQPLSVDLVSSRPTTTVRGTMTIKVGIVHPLNSTGLPNSERTYKPLIDLVRALPHSDKEHVGIVVLRIYGAKDLPKWPNVTHTGWDVDPFVKVSIGKKVVGSTGIIQHSRNPVWFHQLDFPVRESDLSLPIRLTVFDWDRFTYDDYIGEAEIESISTLIGWPAINDLNTGLYPDDLLNMPQFELPLVPVKKPGRVYKTTPMITFRSHGQDVARRAHVNTQVSQPDAAHRDD